MQIITARSVSEALSQGLHTIRIHGISKASRVGAVLVSPRPVMTVYTNPMHRVLTSPMRDANPFFHVMEALWMLAGRNDLPWLVRFNKKFASYSDDGGQTQPGAYGYRWRNYFGYDQLGDIVQELKRSPDTRRCVLTMWDGGSRNDWLEQRADGQPGDFYAAVGGSADVPCNTHVYFDTIDGNLNMTVCCRSNDIIWGAYGANAVHFSFLLEYISAMTGIPMGVYRQFSNNYHLYTNVVARENLMPMSSDVERSDLYLRPETPNSSVKLFNKVRQISLIDSPDDFQANLFTFMAVTTEGRNKIDPDQFSERFFRYVAAPMYNAYMARPNYDEAIEIAEGIRADDWRTAAVEWLQRRQNNLNKKPFTEIVGHNEVDESAEAFGLERS